MLRLTIANVVAHRRRLLSTLAAVTLGVGFLVAVLVLTSTIERSVTGTFDTFQAETEAYVRADTVIATDFDSFRGRIDPALVDTVRRLDGVAEAQPFIQGNGQIILRDGSALGDPGGGPPTFAENWIASATLTPWTLAEGRPPAGDGEVVIDRASAVEGGVSMGDTVTIALTEPLQATVVGIAVVGDLDGFSDTTFAALDYPTALERVGDGLLDGIRVAGDGTLGESELVARIDGVLPAGVEVIDREQLVADTAAGFQGFISFFTLFLTMFAVIALIVAAISIGNTFTILVGQRRRELGLQRAVGATRAQALRGVLYEAIAVGLAGSVGGVVAGFGLALGLNALLGALGLLTAEDGLIVGAVPIVVGAVTGVLVTVVAAMAPAVRATRVPPIAAIGEAGVEAERVSRWRVAAGTLVGAAATAATVGGTAAGQAGITGAGVSGLLIAMILLGPAAVRPWLRAAGAPLAAGLPVTGGLARDNGLRQPRRAAATGLALMIGVAVVTTFTAFATSLRASLDEQIDQAFAGDLVVSAGTFGAAPISPQLAVEIADLEEVDAVTGLRRAPAIIDGTGRLGTAVDPATLPTVVDLGIGEGNIADLNDDGVAVSADLTEENGWELGSPVELGFVDGESTALRLDAIYENASLVGDFIITKPTHDRHTLDRLDTLVAVVIGAATDPAAAAEAIAPMATRYAAGAELQTKAQFREAQAGSLDAALYLIYGLLAVTVLISLMNIANSLSLSTQERTRELGLLRAVGATRRQVRAMVRTESILVAGFGTAGGLALGLVASTALIQATSDLGASYRLPMTAIVVIAVLGGVAGVLASVRPARRAARLEVLDAIAVM